MKTPKKNSVKPSEKAGENYTDAELEELKAFKIPFLEEARDAFSCGAAVGTPAGNFVKLCDEIRGMVFLGKVANHRKLREKLLHLGGLVMSEYLEYSPHRKPMVAVAEGDDHKILGPDMGDHIEIPGPPDFFHSISIVLRRRDMCSVKDIGVKNNGRPKSAATLATTFPMMLAALIEKRQKPGSKARAKSNQWKVMSSRLTMKKITRAEIIEALAREVPAFSSISRSELSRQLRKHNFNRFMLEQPIARNPRK